MTKNKILTLTIVLLFSLFAITGTVFADGSPSYLDPSELVDFDAYEVNVVSEFELDTVSVDVNAATIPFSPRLRTIASLPVGYQTIDAELTATNTDDFYHLPVYASNTTILGFKLSSSNPSIVAILCLLSGSTLSDAGAAAAYADDVPVFVGVPSQSSNQSYVIYVTSLDGSDGDYSLTVNSGTIITTNGTIKQLETDLSVIKTIDSLEIYKNGVVFDSRAAAQAQGWNVVDTTSLAYGFDQITHNLIPQLTNNGKFFASVTASRYTLANGNAQLFPVLSGSSYMLFRSYYQNVSGNVTHIMDFDDVRGIQTPRTLTNDDAEYFSGVPGTSVVGYLVYDIINEEVVDFYSIFNYYYATGYESFSVQ
jgi:hypothetical protein